MSSSLLFIELGAVILGLAVLSRVAGRFGFSPIPLYLLAGLGLGEGGVLPLVTAERFIETGAEMGVILLLLLLGLEYAAEELTESLARSSAVGVLDALLNFAPGFLAGLLLGWGPTAAAFLGGVTYISSSGIVAKQLADMRWVGNRETPTVLSVLVIEDLAMAAYLPLMAALLQGGSAQGVLLTVLGALGAAAAILVIAVRHGDRLSRMVFSRSDESLLLTILGLTMIVAGLAEQIHVSAAVGAFLVGIGLSGEAADRAHGLLTPLRDLFAAVFFVFFGLRVDPGSIPDVAPIALALGAVTTMTKLLTGWWGARRAGVGPSGRRRAAALLVARGEFSLVIAGLAVAAGIEPRLGAVATAYILLMAVVGPVLVRIAGHRPAASVPVGRRSALG